MAEPNARSHAEGSGAAAGLALVTRSAAEADPIESANAASAAIVSVFMIQPLPVVTVRDLRADVRGRSRMTRARQKNINPVFHTQFVMAKIQHAGGGSPRRKPQHLLPF